MGELEVVVVVLDHGDGSFIGGGDELGVDAPGKKGGKQHVGGGGGDGEGLGREGEKL